MTAYSNDTRLVTDFRVRRRRENGSAVLVSGNRFFDIDQTVELIWISCEQEQALEAVAIELAAVVQMPLEESVAAVVAAFDWFVANELATVRAD